ncbi:hypothetical protein A6E15_00210 [Natrinema saccharevitans]|uniref:Uncharacterized protein n=1 Tax=Natrinema saccharevitans TaxID=301967 RepID=A0A1S8ASK1_9EURY|nr:hypothetical protein [Natrinema saccharevitans]OLZ39499.1 hypothetical protein A6E15_00210 [Natrinema saccharevitans]
MKRRTVLPLGIVMLGLGSAYLAAFGPHVLTDPLAGVLLTGFALSAVLMIVGGLVVSVPVGDRTIPWNVFVGIGDVLLAAVVTLSAIRSAIVVGDTASWVFAAAMLAGGSSIAWFGVQTVRDSRHVDLEATPSSRRLVAIALLVAVSVGSGAFVATGV